MASTSARALKAGSIAGCRVKCGGLQQVEDQVIEIAFAHALRVRPVDAVERTRERPAPTTPAGLEPGMDGGGRSAHVTGRAAAAPAV